MENRQRSVQTAVITLIHEHFCYVILALDRAIIADGRAFLRSPPPPNQQTSANCPTDLRITDKSIPHPGPHSYTPACHT